MSSDITKQLLECREYDYALLERTADEIGRLRAALEHYKCGCKTDQCEPDKPKFRTIKCGWVARSALGETT